MELDLSKPLLSKFWLKGRIWKIQYEGLKMICFHCGKFGHSEENCSTNSMEINEVVATAVPEINATHKATVEEQTFGNWMLVKKPPRRRATRQEKIPIHKDPPPKDHDHVKDVHHGQLGEVEGQREPLGGSRFAILGDKSGSYQASA